MKKLLNVSFYSIIALMILVSCKNNDSKSMVLEESQEPPKTVFAENVQVANQKVVIPTNGIITEKEEPTKAGSRITNSVVIDLPKDIATLVQKGDRIEVNIPDIPESVWDGEIIMETRQANPDNETMQLEIEIQADKIATAIGKKANITITTQAERQLMSIPIQALASRTGNKGKVYLFEEGTTSATEVIIYEVAADRVLISNGLSKGDQVVIVKDGYVPAEQTVINK